MSPSKLSTTPSKELDLESRAKRDGVEIRSLESDADIGAIVVENEGEVMHAWFTLIGSSLVYFATFGIVNSFGFFQNYYKDHFLIAVPASTVSFVGTLQMTLMNMLAAPAGSIFDCYGLKVR